MENKSAKQDTSRPVSNNWVWLKPLNHIPAWLKSKYFLFGVGFIIWMLFFDTRDIFTQLEHTRELNDLKLSKSHYQQEIFKETAELERLKTNPATLEKYAREKYLMKRENEDLFLISENPGIGDN
jgi:hypothetical protein